MQSFRYLFVIFVCVESIQYGSYQQDLTFLPELITNEHSISTNKFSSEGPFGYATLCSFPKLELISNSSSMQCIALAISILTAHGRYPFTMLVPRKTKILRRYWHLLNYLNIAIYRYDDVPLPLAAKRYHGNKLSWLISYQRIHAFRLPFKKLLFLDHDMIVTKNIDEIFKHQTDMIGSDCTPHVMWPQDRPDRSRLKNRSHIGSIELVSPSESNFQLLYNLIQNGTLYDSSGQEAGWRWTQTDQTLFPATFTMGRLDCMYQVFPDMCFTATSPPLQHFPLDHFSIIHYTWTARKGPDFMSSDTFMNLMKKFVKFEQRWHPSPDNQLQPSISSVISQMSSDELTARYVSELSCCIF
jgi:hypothetical protein